MLARVFIMSWRIVAATGLIYTSFLWRAAAHSLTCPMPHKISGPGMLKETPVQIAKTGSLLVSRDSQNRVASDNQRHIHWSNISEAGSRLSSPKPPSAVA